MTLQARARNSSTPADRFDTEFEAKLRDLASFLRAFAMSLARHRERAEDLVQETAAKAWRSRRSFIPGSNFKAWIFTILRNEYLSEQRRGWRKVDWNDELGNKIPAHSEEQHWALELADLASAMETLPDAQREALILVGAGGFSYEEAAKKTRAAVGTVKSRVARARQALKEILDGQNPPVQKWRPTKGNAMNDLIAQLSQLAGIDASHGPVLR